MEQPQVEIRQLIAHRLKREAKILDCLKSLGAVTVDELVVAAYDDVAQHLSLELKDIDGSSHQTGQRSERASTRRHLESDRLSGELKHDLPEASWWVYMIRADDHSLYTGVTTDIERRLAEHKAEAPGLIGEPKP